MKSISFPRQIIEQQAKQVAADYAASKGRKPRSHTNTNRACYQLPDGQLRPVYDPYHPSYPEGATPGIGTVHAALCYYANDSHGYEYSVTDFKPL